MIGIWSTPFAHARHSGYRARVHRRRAKDLRPRAHSAVRQRTPLHIGALPESHCKEDLSVAYAYAVAVAIGVSCEAPKRDLNGWDLHFRANDTEHADAEQLAVQLKCTVNRLARVDSGRELSFTIPADDYNQLRKVKTHPPRILVVVEVPHRSPTRWVELSRHELLLKASAWYATLAGEPPLPAGQSTKTIRIPVHQRFTPAALRANMRSCP
jgi:hypothetical protein